LKFFITVFIIFFSAIFCFARESSPILYNSFDGIAIGARPIGMGESFVAISDSADAPYWNPAGLVFLKNSLCTVMFDLARSGAKREDIIRGESLQGEWFTYLCFCSNLGGVSWRPLSNFREENSASYSEREIKVNKYTLSFAIPYSWRVSFGMNINYLYGSLGIAEEVPSSHANISTGNGWGLDWGIIYTYSPLVRVGILLENAPSYIYWSDYRSDPLPLNLRVGLGIKMAKLLTLASDFHERFYVRRDGGSNRLGIYHLGIEYDTARNISLRLGMFGENFVEERKVNYTFGLGYRGNWYLLDLALKRYYVDGIGAPVYSYVSSLSLPF